MATIPGQIATSFIQPKLDDTQARLLFKMASILFTGEGLAGVDWINGAATATAWNTGIVQWWCFHAVTACVISSITYQAGTSTGFPGVVTLSAGDRIFGNITNFVLTSGTGELYRASMQT
jgi:hypothetical protein